MLIKCTDYKDVIELYKEANKPLDNEIIQMLVKTHNNLKKCHDSIEMVVMLSKCTICNYECMLICPLMCDLNNLECSNCGNRTVEEKEELESWQQ